MKIQSFISLAIWSYMTWTTSSLLNVLVTEVAASPTCVERYKIATQCESTTFTSDVDGQVYQTEQSVEKVLCLMKRAYDAKSLPTLNGMHFGAFWETYRMARELSIWIYRLLNIKESIPLRFAFYPTRDGNNRNCLNATTTAYVRGGGTPLCRLLHEVVEQGDGSYIEFITQALDYGYTKNAEGEPFFNKWKWTPDLLAQIRRLGFEPYVRFLHQYNTRYVYDPNLDKFGQMIQNELGHLPPGYFGMSGGGGSGSGFQIYCTNTTSGKDDIIISGGGGLNAGMSAADRGVLLHGYGVGNAGVDVHLNGKTFSLNGYAGKSGAEPYGKLITQVNTKKQWLAFAQAMQKAMAKMQKCHATPGLEVTLKGGGGGGVGFEAFANEHGVEVEPHAMDVGYQFQFALGNTSLLVANADPHEIPFLVCPLERDNNGRIPWRKCLQSKDVPSPTHAPVVTKRPTPSKAPTHSKRPTTQAPTKTNAPTQTKAPTKTSAPTKTKAPSVLRPTTHQPTKFPAGLIMKCAGASKICTVATFTDDAGVVTPYQYTHLGVCHCYTENFYEKYYLGDLVPYQPNCTLFQPVAPDPNEHFQQQWCKAGFTLKELSQVSVVQVVVFLVYFFFAKIIILF